MAKAEVKPWWSGPDVRLSDAERQPLKLTKEPSARQLATVEYAQLKDISDLTALPLAQLKNLKSLTIYNIDKVKLTSFDGIEQLTALESLEANSNPIVDLTPLASLKNMKSLSLNWGKKLKDLSPLAGLQKLESLSLKKNAIKDISVLATCTNLKSLDLEGNKGIKGLLALKGLSKLRVSHYENQAEWEAFERKPGAPAAAPVPASTEPVDWSAVKHEFGKGLMRLSEAVDSAADGDLTGTERTVALEAGRKKLEEYDALCVRMLAVSPRLKASFVEANEYYIDTIREALAKAAP